MNMILSRLRKRSPLERLILLMLVTALIFLVLEVFWPSVHLGAAGYLIIIVAAAAALWLPPLPDAVPAHPPQPRPISNQLEHTTRMLVSSLSSINEVTARQSSATQEQVELIERTNKLLIDFIDLSSRVQDQARSLTGAARQAAESSSSGSTALHQAIIGMSGIRDKVSAIAGTIQSLAQFARRIDDIIGSVSEIATQSNLLALNASIEAARAGVHGRGFAVVADEVRSLSHQSTQSAAQVRAILEEIQTAMRQAIRATEEGLQEVEAGLTVVGQADSVMMQLAQNVSGAQQAVNQVYEVIRQQLAGLEEITIGIERMERVTQTNLESTRAVEAVAAELGRLADNLQDALTVTNHARPQPA